MTEGKHSKITFYENEEKQRKIKTITVRENIREIEEKWIRKLAIEYIEV